MKVTTKKSKSTFDQLIAGDIFLFEGLSTPYIKLFKKDVAVNLTTGFYHVESDLSKNVILCDAELILTTP